MARRAVTWCVELIRMAVIDPETDGFPLLQLIALEADRGCTAP